MHGPGLVLVFNFKCSPRAPANVRLLGFIRLAIKRERQPVIGKKNDGRKNYNLPRGNAEKLRQKDSVNKVKKAIVE